MVSRRIRRVLGGAAGFSLAEIVVVIAVIGVTMGVAIPSLWTYYRASALRSAAEQTVVMLNNARQLAIRLNTTVCVTVDATGMQYHQGSCSGTLYTGPETDTNGYITLASSDLSLSGTTNLCFSYLGAGAATPAPCVSNGTLTVTRSTGGTINVTMASSGRVRLQ